MTRKERKEKQRKLDNTARVIREVGDKHDQLVDKTGIEFWTLWDSLMSFFSKKGKRVDFDYQNQKMAEYLEDTDKLKKDLDL